MISDDDLDICLVPVDGLLVSVLDGEAVLVVPGTLVALHANTSAVEILALLDGDTSLRDVAATLAGRHGGDVSAFVGDVLGAVRELHGAGAVVAV